MVAGWPIGNNKMSLMAKAKIFPRDFPGFYGGKTHHFRKPPDIFMAHYFIIYQYEVSDRGGLANGSGKILPLPDPDNASVGKKEAIRTPDNAGVFLFRIQW
jgi:hypothetical protein